MEEIWKPWKQNPKYMISSQGRIKGLNGSIMKLQKSHNGYLRINLRPAKNEVHRYTVHRLVAETFLADYDDNLVVDHINGIKNDNRIENLRMLPPKLNTQLGIENHEQISKMVRLIISKIGYENTINYLQKIIEEID